MAARDLESAPPNIYQLEEADYDIEKAREAQQSEEDVDKLNAKIDKANEESRKEWEKKRDERVANSEGVHVPDVTKPSTHTEEKSSTAKADDKK
jgi:hypothetical protein